MSDEELWELAKMMALPPERPAEMRYNQLKRVVEELKQKTAAEWTKDLRRNTMPDSEEGKNESRVLIVENEPSLGEKLVSVFAQAGFIVADVSDYSQALQRLDEFKADLIVMESLLPDRDGFQACSELRSRFDIPVILLGKDSSDETWARVMGASRANY